MPLVIKLPKAVKVAPQRITTPVSLMDVAPTVSFLAGLGDKETPFQGQNLITLAGAPDLWKIRPIVAELKKEKAHQISVRIGDHKYIRYLAPYRRELFFDLNIDPDEKDNRAHVSNEKLAELQRYADAILTAASKSGVIIEIIGDVAEEISGAFTITSPSESLDFDLVDFEREGDSFFQVQQEKGTRWRFQFHLDKKDSRDAVRLRLAPEDQVTAIFGSGQSGSFGERILLGHNSKPAKSQIIQVAGNDPILLVQEPPPPQTRPGLWCRIWHLQEEEIELEESTIRALQELGYLGEEESDR